MSTNHWLEGLRPRRIACNLKPFDIARALDISPQTYFRYEKGTRNMPLTMAFRLADMMGTTVDALRTFSPDLETPVSVAPIEPGRPALDDNWLVEEE
jgi:DNA-binding XRE family transcriptional regulator